MNNLGWIPYDRFLIGEGGFAAIWLNGNKLIKNKFI